MTNISEKLVTLENILKSSYGYHKQWNNSTKTLICKTINNLLQKCEKNPFNIAISVSSLGINLETVYINLGKIPTQIIQNESILVKELGCLYFAQDVDGKIIVYMEYSFVENFKNSELLVLNTYIPSNLTENVIEQLFEQFLDELINYEETTIKRKIGF